MSINNAVLVDFFDKVYIINLATRQDRRDEMQIELQKIGLSLAHPDIYLFPAVRPDNYEGWPSLGAKGCFMSHYQVLQDAKANGYGKILIIEDDLNFVSNFNAMLQTLVGQLSAVQWDVFYGGYEVLDGNQADIASLTASAAAESKAYQLISHQMPLRTTHCVGFNKQTIATLVDYLGAMAARPSGDPKGGPMHVDGAYSWFRREHATVKTLIALPQLGYQRSSATDIHDLRWYDKLPLVSCATALLRKMKNTLSKR